MLRKVESVAALVVISLLIASLQSVFEPISALAATCSDANHFHVQAQPGGGGGQKGQGIATPGFDGMFVPIIDDNVPCFRVSSTGNLNSDGDYVEVGWMINQGASDCVNQGANPFILITKGVSGTFSCIHMTVEPSADANGFWRVWENKHTDNQTWDFWQHQPNGDVSIGHEDTNMSHGVPYTLGERFASGATAFARYIGANYYTGSSWLQWSVQGTPTCMLDTDPGFDNGFANGAEDFRVHASSNVNYC